jgi:hypothetical protein
MLAVTQSLARHSNTAVPAGSVGRTGRDGRFYAQYGPGCSFAALPLFWVGQELARVARLGLGWTDQGEELMVSLFNPLVVALTAVVLALAALELGVGRRWAVGGGLLCSFGTGLFVQMKDFNSEPLTALLFLGACYVLLRQRRRVTGGGMALVGALAGAAILTRPANALGAALLAGAAVALAAEPHPLPPPGAPTLLAGEGVVEGNLEDSDRDKGSWASVVWRIVCLALPLLAGVALYGWYNYARFGNPLDTGYPTITFDYPVLRGLWLQLFSLERGLVWYDPLVLLAPAGLALLWRRGRRRAVTLVAALAAGYVLLYSLYAQSPGGGHSVGQRFLLVVMPLLVLAALPALERGSASRAWTARGVGAIIAISVLVQLPLVWINPSYYYAALGAQQERTGAAVPVTRADQALIVRSWAVAVEVTRDALTRPDWVRSLAQHTQPSTTATAMLPGPRSFHVPYCWWALSWAYGVPGRWVVVGVLVNLLLAAGAVKRLSGSLSLALEEAC